MTILAQEHMIRELAKTLENKRIGKVWISKEGAERIARVVIEEPGSITETDAIIRVNGFEFIFSALSTIAGVRKEHEWKEPHPMTDEELSAAIYTYLPDDVAINFHRDLLMICLPCVGGKTCPICGAAGVQYYASYGPLISINKQSVPVLKAIFGQQ